MESWAWWGGCVVEGGTPSPDDGAGFSPKLMGVYCEPKDPEGLLWELGIIQELGGSLRRRFLRRHSAHADKITVAPLPLTFRALWNHKNCHKIKKVRDSNQINQNLSTSRG